MEQVHVLSTENESATDNCEHLIKSFEEAAKEHIPKKKRTKKKCLSDDARVSLQCIRVIQVTITKKI